MDSECTVIAPPPREVIRPTVVISRSISILPPQVVLNRGRLPHPLKADKTLHIVGQVVQPDLRPRPHHTNRANHLAPHRSREMAEYMLHPRPHLRARLVTLLLPLRELPPSVRLAVNPAAQALFLQLFFDLR